MVLSGLTVFNGMRERYVIFLKVIPGFRRKIGFYGVKLPLFAECGKGRGEPSYFK